MIGYSEKLISIKVHIQNKETFIGEVVHKYNLKWNLV